MAVGKLIVVTGPAAVGKSTVTKAPVGNPARSGELWLAIEPTFARFAAAPVDRGRPSGFKRRARLRRRAVRWSLELELGSDSPSTLGVSSFGRGRGDLGVASSAKRSSTTTPIGATGRTTGRRSVLGRRLRSRCSMQQARRAHPRGSGTRMAARRVGRYDVEADLARRPTRSSVASSIVAIGAMIISRLGPRRIDWTMRANFGVPRGSGCVDRRVARRYPSTPSVSRGRASIEEDAAVDHEHRRNRDAAMRAVARSTHHRARGVQRIERQPEFATHARNARASTDATSEAPRRRSPLHCVHTRQLTETVRSPVPR